MKIDLKKAIKSLNEFQNIAIPTETVYGLAGRIDDEESIKRIFSLKQRPFFDPLIVHVSDYQSATKIWKDSNIVLEKLAKNFWPGPLTLISTKASFVSDLITASLDSVAVRVPNHPITLELLKAIDGPIAAPSANMFTKTSPTSPNHVISEFGDKVLVLDGGLCTVGIESTVLEVVEKKDDNFELILHRPGKVLLSEIEQFLKEESIKFKFVKTDKIKSPGNMPFHYQPAIPLHIVESNFDDESSEELLLPTQSSEAARVLYSEMRRISNSKAKSMHLFKNKYPKDGLWLAIWERLEKASFKA